MIHIIFMLNKSFTDPFTHPLMKASAFDMFLIYH